ncbi:MAG: MoxR family ATPase [Gemmatimonadetes bacterium]|nr:MoxR family ATPase [Gemmatimonadota bacterium]
MTSPFSTVADLETGFAAEGYLADVDVATALFLALKLGRPLFLEGEAGVGKTELARTLATVTGGELIRLQCYEGIDAATALYEWDYPRQMLEIRLLEARGEAGSAQTKNIFGPEFLVRRPLLRAIESVSAAPPVLLIDEIDRADEEFEAFLLELLADFAITIPELGTIKAKIKPYVILTSNRTREVHDALKRRCFYHWIDYPSATRELAILKARLPQLPDRLAAEVVAFVQRLRTSDLSKLPGVAETIDWAAALDSLGARQLGPEDIDRSLGVLLKYQEDVSRIRGDAARTLLAEIQAGR